MPFQDWVMLICNYIYCHFRAIIHEINNKRVLQFSSIAKNFVYLSFEEYEVNIHNAIVHKI